MNFLNTIHEHEKKINAIKEKIDKHPDEWMKFQNDVNHLIDSVFSLCWEFERQYADDEHKVYKLKRIFSENFSHYFKLGSLGRMVIEKPFGYHGDFLIIDKIYANNAQTIGLERCMDNYFLMTGASIATRNRKEDFKKYLAEIIKIAKQPVRLMDLASGPCRDVQELCGLIGSTSPVLIDFVDHDVNAIEYGKNVMSSVTNVKYQFIQKNAIRIALAKDIEKTFEEKYDVVFSTGLFDYLDDKIAIPLIKNLKKVLKPNGLLIISNYRDRWSNSSRHFMEWGGGWELIYRSEEDFKRIFIEAGFTKEQLSLKYESQKIMQYRFAKN